MNVHQLLSNLGISWLASTIFWILGGETMVYRSFWEKDFSCFLLLGVV